MNDRHEDALVPSPDLDPRPAAEGGAPTSTGRSTGVPPVEPRARRRADLLATFAIVGALAAIVIGKAALRRLGPHPSEGQCEALLERYAEHVRRAADPEAPPAAASSRGAPEPARRGKLARCTELLAPEEMTCAMSARGADEIERCIE